MDAFFFRREFNKVEIDNSTNEMNVDGFVGHFEGVLMGKNKSRTLLIDTDKPTQSRP